MKGCKKITNLRSQYLNPTLVPVVGTCVRVVRATGSGEELLGRHVARRHVLSAGAAAGGQAGPRRALLLLLHINKLARRALPYEWQSLICLLTRIPSSKCQLIARAFSIYPARVIAPVPH